MNKRDDRRNKALARLEKQLESGNKTERKTNKKVPLSDTDKKRIEKEINILSK